MFVDLERSLSLTLKILYLTLHMLSQNNLQENSNSSRHIMPFNGNYSVEDFCKTGLSFLAIRKHQKNFIYFYLFRIFEYFRFHKILISVYLSVYLSSVCNFLVSLGARSDCVALKYLCQFDGYEFKLQNRLEVNQHHTGEVFKFFSNRKNTFWGHLISFIKSFLSMRCSFTSFI